MYTFIILPESTDNDSSSIPVLFEIMKSMLSRLFLDGMISGHRDILGDYRLR